jgi:hypothetical protein
MEEVDRLIQAQQYLALLRKFGNFFKKEIEGRVDTFFMMMQRKHFENCLERLRTTRQLILQTQPKARLPGHFL